MTILIKTIQLILALSFLVLIHEFGHFGFAKLFHVRVNKFYMFFNWKFSIVRFKKIAGKWQVRWFAPNLPTETPRLDILGKPMLDEKGKKIMDPIDVNSLPEDDWRRYPETTEWGIGWIPLGGYCAIDGMVDETTDSNQLASEPKPWEYRAQPAWKRLFIITGGVLMNVIGAAVIYSCMLFHWGSEQLPMQNAYLGYEYCQTAQNNGFVNGDIVLTVDGDSVKYAPDALEKIVIEGGTQVLVRRADKDTLLVLPENFSNQMLGAEEKFFMHQRIPFVVDSVMNESPAALCGLHSGDSVVGLNGKLLYTQNDISVELESIKGQRVDVTYMRNGERLTDSIEISEDGKLGVYLRNPADYFVTEVKEYSFWTAIPAGWQQMYDVLANYVKQFRIVFTKEGAKSMGGFASIGNLFPAAWNWYAFWAMTAFLSVILAFMNILPIPVLDGGYVLFILYEMIFRRKPSDKFMDIALNIGFFLLLALLIYANGNDIIRYCFK